MTSTTGTTGSTPTPTIAESDGDQALTGSSGSGSTAAAHPTGSIGWFEIASDDPDRAQAFYSGLFGWSMQPGTTAGFDYRDISTGPGHQLRGGLLGTGGRLPAHAVFVVLVDDVPAAAERAQHLGGALQGAPMTTETGLSFAYLTDLDGNLFAVFSPPG